MSWEVELQEDEVLRWQGRPAPRCYTFRNWRHSLFGVLLLVLALYWLALGTQLAAVYGLSWLPLVPVPFLLVGIYLSLGHLLLARLEWDQVRYAVTDRRVLLRRGPGGRRRQELALGEVVWFRLQPHGEELGTLKIRGRTPENRLTLCCVEYPRRVTALLESAMAEAGDSCALEKTADDA